MQPKIIVSKSREERDQEIWRILSESKISQNNPEIFSLEDEKIGIAQIKQLINHLATKPFGQTAKSAVIFNGNTISPDAQNALLKTLEEPSGDSVILIGVDSETKLLPTILSRCLVINLTEKEESSSFDLDRLISSTVEERFELIEKTTDKETFLKDLTTAYRQKTIKGNPSSLFLEDLLEAQIWKESNVNLRTILEYLMLRLEK
jgi:DNA polymerase III delta prime subunit